MMRKFIQLVENAAPELQAELDEKYTENNTALLHYMRKKEFDPYQHWYEVCEWLEENDHLYMVSQLLDQDFQLADDLHDEEPDVFYKLPAQIQKECASEVIEKVMQHDPSEAPTWAHLDLNQNNLLKRQTWLIHFSDYAHDIAYNGFTHGSDDMSKLGLTTWTKHAAKQYGGYNFAFIAGSRDANIAASNGKYGKNAVMFQNAGVYAEHYGDQEDQVMFWGADVNKHEIVLLTKTEYDGWCVEAKGKMSPNRDYAFVPNHDARESDFEQCVKWVMNNFAQYRRVLTGR